MLSRVKESENNLIARASTVFQHVTHHQFWRESEYQLTQERHVTQLIASQGALVNSSPLISGEG